MKFIEDIKEKDYRKFFNKTKNAHFLQSFEWGQVQKETRNQIPCYVGVIDDNNNLMAVALLLKKKTPLNMCYFYSPRGFVLDYNNKELFTFFITELKKYLKRENAIYLRVDPGIKYQDINEDASKKENGENNYDLFNLFGKLGFKHQGFYKLYEGNQPRYTIRINLHDTWENIEKNMAKTFMKTVRKSYNYNLEITLDNNIDVFYKLMLNNAQKNDFKAYDLNYYQTFYKYFAKAGHVKIFNAVCYPDEIIKNTKEALNSIKQKIANKEIVEKRKADINNQVKKLEKDLEIFESYKNKYKDGMVVCSLICSYTDHAAWTLYIGNDYIGTHTAAVNRCYYEALKDAYENKLDFYDLFGTIGDPKTNYKNLAGLHEFKRKLGGEYIEFFGDMDLINKPFWYKVLPFLLKIYRTIKK